MSLFGSMHDPNDMFMATYMRQMRHMDNVMNSMFGDPFGNIMGDMGMPLSIMGPPSAHTAMMPFMPQMNMNRLMTGGMMNNSFSSSTIVMSNGPDGRPQVFSSTSSTKVGPNGVKETRQTVEDSRTGTKKMTIGHHIDDRAHVIEREQNVQSGDLEERQEFINIDEEEADDFNHEFEQRSRRAAAAQARGRLMPARQTPLLALPAPPPATSNRRSGTSNIGSRRPLRHSSSPLALTAPVSSSAGVRHTYGSVHPQRSKQRGHKSQHNNANDY
ncbi:myeloid leukemia factor-like isoform X2 [Arctopsyche grandis]|uniref:myeloid leukemia factor-like isoform X2 n=1 Tax=Arctopsyche grandis TaxID=121162 RepID=UPI00406D6CCB